MTAAEITPPDTDILNLSPVFGFERRDVYCGPYVHPLRVREDAYPDAVEIVPKIVEPEIAQPTTPYAKRWSKVGDHVDFVKRVDWELRRDDTPFARFLTVISPKRGMEYIDSREKRLLELAISVPAAILATPPMLIFGLIQKLQDGKEMFYKSPRMQDAVTGEEYDMTKIRTLEDGNGLTEKSPQLGSVIDESHPAIFGIGKFYESVN